MADDQNQTDKPNALPDEGQMLDRLPVTIQSQYIKDLSFENPNAPMPLRNSEGKPAIGVDFAMDAKKLKLDDFENSYEVSLYITVKAGKGEITTFIAELEYCMMVTLNDVPEEKIHPLLLIEMPNYMFPFARQIIADLTQKAGYMPFLLSPVNFKALYRKQFGGPQPTVHERSSEKEKETA